MKPVEAQPPNELLVLQSLWVDRLSPCESSNDALEKCLSDNNFDGISVYQDSCHSHLFNHLADTFPLTERLLGHDFWHALLSEYINLTPCNESNIARYGKTLSAFVSQFPPAQSVPYAADLIDIEWHWASLYDHPIPALFNMSLFSLLTEADFLNLSFIPNKTLMTLQSDFPIYQIWAMNYYQHDSEIDINNNNENVFVFLHEGNACLSKVSEEEFTFLQHLKKGLNWPDVVDKMLAFNPTIDLNSLLQKALVQQWISHFKLN